MSDNTQKSQENTIYLENIKKIYDENTSILYKSLQIKRKGFTVIRGKSGSGKSTLFNIISGIDRDIKYETNSAFIVNGIDFLKASNKQITNFRRKNIGFVFQDYGLLHDFNIEENIMIYHIANKKEMSLAKEDIREFFNEVKEINKFLKKYPSELSGGQQQRVALLRAILHKPSIILADEPTSNIDDDASNSILKKLIKLSEESSIVLITHQEDIIDKLKKEDIVPDIFTLEADGTNGFILEKAKQNAYF